MPSRRRYVVLAAIAVVAACTDLRSAADTGSDTRTPSEDAPAGDGGTEALGGDAALDAGGAACTPSCTLRACGKDPVCGMSCGTCEANEACEVRDAGSSCEAITILWELDGNVVAKLTTHEVFASGGAQTLFFPHYGRNVTLTVAAGGATGKISDCTAEKDGVLTLNSLDNGYTGLAALPAAWKGQIWAGCGAQSSGDTVIARDASLTANGPTRIAGTYELVVQGGGDRAGSVLKVRGAFDVTPASP